MTRLSVIIITCNEAANIEACLASVAFADEVVVLDSGSTDATVELVLRMGAVLHATSDWPGFGIQKNRALALATGDWILSIDADERVTPELRAEILMVISSASAKDVYCFSRLSSYCGQYMMHSGWNPDFVVRLFRRGAAQFSDDLVHEKLLTKRPIAKLGSPLLHLSFPSFEMVLDKINRYSTAGALGMSKRGKAASLWSAIGHGAWAFFRTYVVRRGFLDGQMGLALAISNAEGTYYRHVKRWLVLRQQAEKRGVGE